MFDPVNKVVTFNGIPTCTDKETYKTWREFAQRLPPGEAGFCTDCEPSYQRNMIAAGRCENPWIEFVVVTDDKPPPRYLTEEGKILFSLSDDGVVGKIPWAIKRSGQKKPRTRTIKLI